MNQNESLLNIQTYRAMLEAGMTAILSKYISFIAARGADVTAMLSKHISFITAHSEASEKRDAILKEYRDSADNMFLSIFKFRLENFHSEILRKLLDKNTPEIGCIQYLSLFTRLLRDIQPSLKNYTFTDTVSVVCEAGEKQEDGRIDIFVYDTQYGIIIENKINGAADQPNQLAKYLKFAKRLEKEIIAVVYIPPPWKNSAPDLESYSESFQEYIPELREKLVVLPVADIHTKKDLVHGFLGTCLDLPENTDTQKYILSQYAKLLVSIKGAKEMTKDVDMALLTECYKDKNSIIVLENLAEVWNNREYLLGNILRDTVRKRLISELGFYVDDGDENGLYKGIKGNVWLCFYSGYNYPYWFGFWGGDKLEGSFKNKLQGLLDMATPEYFGKTNDWGDPKKWLLKQFLIGECKKPLSDIAEHLIGRYQFLEEKTLKALEA